MSADAVDMQDTDSSDAQWTACGSVEERSEGDEEANSLSQGSPITNNHQ